MAKELDDCEYWLPAEFLTDEDLLTDFKTDGLKSQKQDFFSHGYGSCFGFNSDLSSPVESVNGSTGTESDEDDLVSGLTRKNANSTVESSTVSPDYSAKGLKLYGSPQSTLCGSSLACVSQISSPTEVKSTAGWDLLHTAAEEVMRLRMVEDEASHHSVKPFAKHQKPMLAAPAVRNPDSVSAYYLYKSEIQAQLAYLQLQAIKYQRMKLQEQMMRRREWNRPRMSYQFSSDASSKVSDMSQVRKSMDAWPTLQQSHYQQQPHLPVSCTPSVVLGQTVLKKERNGTGVFLPRRPGSCPADTRKRAGCSSVLPGKAAHDLNASTLPPNHDSSSSAPSHPRIHNDIRLPQDWTY